MAADYLTDNLQDLFKALREATGEHVSITEGGDTATGVITSFTYVSAKQSTLTIYLKDEDDVIIDIHPNTKQTVTINIIPEPEPESTDVDMSGLTYALYEKSHEPSFETVEEAETFAQTIIDTYLPAPALNPTEEELNNVAQTFYQASRLTVNVVEKPNIVAGLKAAINELNQKKNNTAS